MRVRHDQRTRARAHRAPGRDTLGFIRWFDETYPGEGGVLSHPPQLIGC